MVSAVGRGGQIYTKGGFIVRCRILAAADPTEGPSESLIFRLTKSYHHADDTQGVTRLEAARLSAGGS